MCVLYIYPLLQINSAIFRMFLMLLILPRNLEVLTLGKGRLCVPFFQSLTDCQTLRILTINNATLGHGLSGLSIFHDRLHDLRIMQCGMARVNIRWQIVSVTFYNFFLTLLSYKSWFFSVAPSLTHCLWGTAMCQMLFSIAPFCVSLISLIAASLLIFQFVQQ